MRTPFRNPPFLQGVIVPEVLPSPTLFEDNCSLFSLDCPVITIDTRHSTECMFACLCANASPAELKRVEGCVQPRHRYLLNRCIMTPVDKSILLCKSSVRVSTRKKCGYISKKASQATALSRGECGKAPALSCSHHGKCQQYMVILCGDRKEFLSRASSVNFLLSFQLAIAFISFVKTMFGLVLGISKWRFLIRSECSNGSPRNPCSCWRTCNGIRH